MFCSSKLRPVTGKNKVAIFAGLVAGKAGLVHCLVVGFAVSKLSGFFIGPTGCGRREGDNTGYLATGTTKAILFNVPPLLIRLSVS
jgi:hypothetical protein